MIRFEMEKRIFACHVNKNLLTELEDYIKNEIPKQINVPKKNFNERYTISIRDKSGQEEIKSISHHSLSLFPDSTNKIEINVRFFQEKEFTLSISFDSEYSKKYKSIKISYEANNAREITLGIYDSLSRIIESHRNQNELFHPTGNIEIFFSVSKFLLILSAFLMLEIYSVLALLFLLIFLITITYSFVGSTFKHYITYETNQYFKLQKSYNVFQYILISIIIGIVLIFVSGVWKNLLTWIK